MRGPECANGNRICKGPPHLDPVAVDVLADRLDQLIPQGPFNLITFIAREFGVSTVAIPR